MPHQLRHFRKTLNTSNLFDGFDMTVQIKLSCDQDTVHLDVSKGLGFLRGIRQKHFACKHTPRLTYSISFIRRYFQCVCLESCHSLGRRCTNECREIFDKLPPKIQNNFFTSASYSLVVRHHLSVDDIFLLLQSLLKRNQLIEKYPNVIINVNKCHQRLQFDKFATDITCCIPVRRAVILIVLES